MKKTDKQRETMCGSTRMEEDLPGKRKNFVGMYDGIRTSDGTENSQSTGILVPSKGSELSEKLEQPEGEIKFWYVR